MARDRARRAIPDDLTNAFLCDVRAPPLLRGDLAPAVDPASDGRWIEAGAPSE